MNQRIKLIASKVEAALHSSRGKDVLLYLLFVVVAFVFWVFLALDTERQRDFDVPVALTEVPDSVTLIGQMPEKIAVSVKAKDSQLLRFLWGKMSVLKFNYEELADDNIVNISHAKLDSRLRDYFGTPAQVISFRPDSVVIPYTTQPGVKVKLLVQADIRPNPLYILSSAPKANVDSVTLYSSTDIPHTLKFVSTEPIAKSGLKDTARYEVKVKPIAGVRIIPDKVTVTIPIEPLISRKRTVMIDALNVPEDKSLVTFPSKIEINYLVPMSSYTDEYPIKASVDYNDTRLPGNKLPITLSVIPSIYHNVSTSLESVEYIIENR